MKTTTTTNPPTDHSVLSPVGRIHYTRSGYGPALFFLHSNGSSSRYWVRLVARFSQYFSCYNIDTLGWGRSEIPSQQHSVSELAECLTAVMDVAKVERTSICATHAGALFGFDFTVRYPERVERLILDGLPFYDTDTGQSFYKRVIQPHMSDQSTFDRPVYPRFTWEQAEHRDAASYASGYGMNREEWERGAEVRERRRYWQRLSYDSILSYDAVALAHRIKVPVLLTVGSGDVLREFAEPANAAIVNSSLRVFPTESGTSAPTGATEDFFATAIAFLDPSASA